MAPIRRYLRLTPHTTIEVRIYMHDPSLATTWLLHPSPPTSIAPSPVLPRIIAAIRPLVLPKLREENIRAKQGKSTKKQKSVKDTVSGDDFEVSIFLTEMDRSGCRHGVLRRERVEKANLRGRGGAKRRQGELKGWLTGGEGTEGRPLELGDEEVDEESVVVIREESDEEDANTMLLQDYPEAKLGEEGAPPAKKRRRRGKAEDVVDISDDEGFSSSATRVTRQSGGAEDRAEQPQHGKSEDKKKLGLHTQYDGYAIYGRILCLVVKRRGGSSLKAKTTADDTGQQMLESWVSTQAQQEGLADD